MDLKDWTFVQREGARIPRHTLDKEMEAAQEKSQEEADILMEDATTALRPLKFKVKRPETDYEGDSPSRSERWGGEFITTVNAEADGGALMDGNEVADRATVSKMMKAFAQSMKRRGMKGGIDLSPKDRYGIETELEGEDRRRGVELYILLESYRGKFYLTVRADVSVGFR